MQNTLFRHSDVADPFSIYTQMLDEHPVYFDAANNLWAVYSYEACRQILNHPAAHIPDPNQAVIGQMHDTAALIARHLVRLQNPPDHDSTRQLVMSLVRQMHPVNTADLLDTLLADCEPPFDYVNLVAKKLPVLAILSALDFPTDKIDALAGMVESLVQFMLPGKSPEVIDELNRTATVASDVVLKHIRATPRLQALEDDNRHYRLTTLIANILGLLIQSYDAGRGILSNILFHRDSTADKRHIVTETLRFAPPVHNTRRILTENIVIGDIAMKAGDTVLLVLASANRDPAQFENPAQFDPLRLNNDTHLTFGSGGHECVARHFVGALAADTLAYLDARCPNLRIMTETLEFEPLVNVRLPRRIDIKF